MCALAKVTFYIHCMCDVIEIYIINNPNSCWIICLGEVVAWVSICDFVGSVIAYSVKQTTRSVDIYDSNRR